MGVLWFMLSNVWQRQVFCSDFSDDCSTYITTASGSINSLSFPGSYPGDKDCTWLIEVEDKNIALMFTQFDVYGGSNPGGCKNDYVEVRDGLTDSSPVIGGKYCNQNRTMLITTNKNNARIYFHSGIANFGHKGFLLYFLSVTKGSFQKMISIIYKINVCNIASLSSIEMFS